jgi:3-oxoadipate enol-lactonase
MTTSDWPQIPYVNHAVTTDDGVVLSAQCAGDGPAVLLVNGIGVTRPGMDCLAEHLLPGHRVITWDYRGTRGSPVAPAVSDFSLPRHARDALAVLDALAIPRASVLGWSLGVPVGLELIRLVPDRVTTFGALFGAPGLPFRAAFPGPVADVAQALVDGLQQVPAPAQGALRLAQHLAPLAWQVLTGLGFVGRTAHREVFRRNVASVAEADKRAYFGTMRELARHDGRDVLPGIRCPVLVVAGGADWVTPPAAAEEMARLTPGAEYVLIPDATHFGVIEHGPALFDPIDRLLARADR